MHSLQRSKLGKIIYRNIHDSDSRGLKGFSILPKLVPLASVPDMTTGPCTAHTRSVLQEMRRIPCGR